MEGSPSVSNGVTKIDEPGQRDISEEARFRAELESVFAASAFWNSGTYPPFGIASLMGLFLPSVR